MTSVMYAENLACSPGVQSSDLVPLFRSLDRLIDWSIMVKVVPLALGNAVLPSLENLRSLAMRMFKKVPQPSRCPLRADRGGLRELCCPWEGQACSL